MHHIKNTLPEIKAKIQGGLIKYQQELTQLGDPMGSDASSQMQNTVHNTLPSIGSGVLISQRCWCV